MKKLLALSIALALGGCASMPALQKVAHHPKAVAPAPVVSPAPTVTVVPAAPVPPATFKMRWSQRVGKLRNIPLFHHKKEN
jgi:hypothetical protein